MIGFIHDKGAPSTMTDHNIECFYAVFKEFKTKDSAEPVFATKLAHEAADEAKQKEEADLKAKICKDLVEIVKKKEIYEKELK